MVFDPNFAVYATTRTSIAVLAGRVDSFPVSRHRLDLGSTENPVESGGTLTDNAVKRREKLKLDGWVSDLLPAPGNTLSHDRATDAWGAIVSLFVSRTPVTIVTPLRVYHNMIVNRAEADENKRTGRSLRFTLELAEIIFSETEITRLNANNVDENGPAADRTSIVDRGDIQSTQIP